MPPGTASSTGPSGSPPSSLDAADSTASSATLRWEHVELKEQEWFAARLPKIAETSGNPRRKLIVALADDHPELHTAYRSALRRADGERASLAHSGRYPLTGRGRINTYPAFAEHDRDLLACGGRLGVSLPTGVATDATTQHYFRDLVTSRSLVSLYDFENRDRILEAVDSRVKFCLLTLTGRDSPADAATFAFCARRPGDPRRPGFTFTLTPRRSPSSTPQHRHLPRLPHPPRRRDHPRRPTDATPSSSARTTPTAPRGACPSCG